MQRYRRGFTLVEALIALAAIAILAGFTVPAVGSAIEAAHAGSARAALLDSLLHSLNHAALTGSEVVLCPGDARGGCRASSDWSRGWIAYADLDGNRRRGANETLLHAEPALPGKVRLLSTSGRTRVVFQPGGGNTGSNVTFTLCDGRGAARASTLVLANDGRLRAGVATATAVAACLAAQ